MSVPPGASPRQTGVKVRVVMVEWNTMDEKAVFPWHSTTILVDSTAYSTAIHYHCTLYVPHMLYVHKSTCIYVDTFLLMSPGLLCLQPSESGVVQLRGTRLTTPTSNLCYSDVPLGPTVVS